MAQSTLRVHHGPSDQQTNRGITPPEKQGSYAVTSTGEYEEGERHLRVLKLPVNMSRVSFNLSDGYRRMSDGGPVIYSRIGEEPGLNHFLKWILSNKEDLRRHASYTSTSELGVDFVTIRGLISMIMCTPYERFSDWSIGVTKYRGSYFMYHLLTDQERDGELNRTEFLNLMAYSGLRFENFVTEPADRDEDDGAADMSGRDDYYCVIKVKLDRHSLMYGAETDCIRNRSFAADPQPRHLVEIKTTQTVGNDDWKRTKLQKHKMLKWWTQCYLTGIQTIVCGYRGDDNYVREIDVIQVSDLPKMGRQFWSTDVCLNFLNRFLDFVKRVVIEDDPEIVYKFNWDAGSDYVTVRQTAVTSDRFVIQDWFVDQL